jgi:hypothetical protein
MSKKQTDHSALSLEDKIIMVEHLVVIHPAMQAILDKMDYCREHARYALESIGLLVIGVRGTGKTTAQNYYLEKNAVEQSKTSTFIPVLQIRIPVPATVGGLTSCLLTALGDPFPEKGSLTARTLRIYALVEKCLVQLVMFDEFQHFAERESFKLNRTVSDWTKNFMGHTRKPLILFGTPKSVEILDGTENEQLRRRFPFRMQLEFFGWDIEVKRAAFRKFLYKIDEMLPLATFSDLADPLMAARIHFATGGSMNEIMRLIRAAAVLALRRELPKIDLDLLRESFEENLATNAPGLENPFK